MNILTFLNLNKKLPFLFLIFSLVTVDFYRTNWLLQQKQLISNFYLIERKEKNKLEECIEISEAIIDKISYWQKKVLAKELRKCIDSSYFSFDSSIKTEIISELNRFNLKLEAYTNKKFSNTEEIINLVTLSQARIALLLRANNLYFTANRNYFIYVNTITSDIITILIISYIFYIFCLCGTRLIEITKASS